MIEPFCSACLSLVPAALGVGGITVASTAKKGRKWKKSLLWASVGLTLISILVFVVLKNRSCSSCR